MVGAPGDVVGATVMVTSLARAPGGIVTTTIPSAEATVPPAVPITAELCCELVAGSFDPHPAASNAAAATLSDERMNAPFELTVF